MTHDARRITRGDTSRDIRFIAIDRQHPGRAEGTIYGPREDLKIPQDLEAAPVTCLYPDRFGNRTAGGLAIFVREA